jgi:D-alanine-D-alanine ligase
MIVLHGEVPREAGKDEQDVLFQVEVVFQALSELGYDPVIVPLSMNLTEIIVRLLAIRPAFVFNLVESITGQGRLIYIAPAIMDFLKIPYTGSRTEAMFLTSNKLLAKKILQTTGIATPPWLSLDETCLDKGETGTGFLSPGPYIIKSVWENASVGLDEDSVILARNRDHLRHEMVSRLGNLGGECFAEVFIEGREFNISLLSGDNGPEVLPPAEIRFDDYPPDKNRVVGYRAKWDEDSFEYHHTPRCFDFPKKDGPLLRHLVELARRCWYLFGLRGYARVDFRVDQAGIPWVLEINANPCLSPDSGFVAAAVQSGLGFNRIIERIIKDTVTKGL